MYTNEPPMLPPVQQLRLRAATGAAADELTQAWASASKQLRRWRRGRQRRKTCRAKFANAADATAAGAATPGGEGAPRMVHDAAQLPRGPRLGQLLGGWRHGQHCCPAHFFSVFRVAGPPRRDVPGSYQGLPCTRVPPAGNTRQWLGPRRPCRPPLSRAWAGSEQLTRPGLGPRPTPRAREAREAAFHIAHNEQMP